MRQLFVAILVLGITGSYAQVINEELIPENRMEQHQDFLADETPYPAKPRNMWAIGINAGVHNISGDVKTRPFGGVGGTAIGYGLNVRKSIGYAASFRLGYVGGKAYGQNWDQASVGQNDALLGRGYSNPRPGDTSMFSAYVPNYETSLHDLSLDLLVNLNNLKYHKGENKVSFFLGGGVGAMLYQTKYDATDGSGNVYDYEAILAGSDPADRGELRDQRDLIEAALDGEFETLAEIDNNKATIGDGEDARNLRFRTSFGGGVQFKLGKRVSLDLEHRAILAFDDLLDGQRWENGGRTFTPDKDVWHYSSVGVSIHLGKNATEPLWFENPQDYIYSELKAIQPPDMSDADNDGVLDLLDQELDTPEGFPVDSKGVTADSDKDGCPDGEDPEPYSSPNFPIVDCKNEMPNLLSAEEIEELIDNKLDPIMGGAGSNWFLPAIYYNLNSSRIRPDAYDELSYVAEVASKYPNLKIEVVGHTDSRASESYNEELSKKRAESAIQHLVDNYNLSEDRFILLYKGESEQLFPDARSASQHEMNRRVEFRAVQGDN